MRSIWVVGILAPVALNQAAWGQAEPPAPRRAPNHAPVAARLANADDLRTRLRLNEEYSSVAGVEAIKIAILDYGFEGLGTERKYLPSNAVVVEHYDADMVREFALGDPAFRRSLDPLNRHGRSMAQIVWAVTGSRPKGPRFFLLNANGPTMLRRAVRYAIEQRVDIILFSNSFEGAGNGDGRGPINRIVDQALAAGIIWINAAGNYGRHVYHGPVNVLSDGYVRLRSQPDIAALRFRNHLDENTVSITLTWNDYRDDEDAGTDKDLDLFVEDWAGRPVASSEKIQVAREGAIGANESRNPRERIVLTDLAADPGLTGDPNYCYRIRIKAKGGKFGADDRVRVLVSAARPWYLPPGATTPRDAVDFLDASGDGELYPPADHPTVVTVGDSSPDSSLGPTLDHRPKPDVIFEDSRAFFTDGEVSAGSSNAAAYLAGIVAVLKAVEPRLGPAELLYLARCGPTVPRSRIRSGDSVSNAAVSSSEPIRVWYTPSRARLAEAVRRER